MQRASRDGSERRKAEVVEPLVSQRPDHAEQERHARPGVSVDGGLPEEAQQELLVAAAHDSARLAHVRYDGGRTTYLEVLTNEANYLAAELALSQARRNEMLSLVQIYNALGGGWQQ